MISDVGLLKIPSEDYLQGFMWLGAVLTSPVNAHLQILSALTHMCGGVRACATPTTANKRVQAHINTQHTSTDTHTHTHTHTERERERERERQREREREREREEMR
jgi:hypothetical protein